MFLLRGSGRAANITDKVSEMSGKEVLLASTFMSLDRLERKGLVESRRANPETEPELKGRRFSWPPWPENAHSRTRGQPPGLWTASWEVSHEKRILSARPACHHGKLFPLPGRSPRSFIATLSIWVRVTRCCGTCDDQPA